LKIYANEHIFDNLIIILQRLYVLISLGECERLLETEKSDK